MPTWGYQTPLCVPTNTPNEGPNWKSSVLSEGGERDPRGVGVDTGPAQ